jgi:glucose uptake protein GlcU
MSDVPQLSELETVFTRVVQVALGFGGIVLFIMLLIGGFKYLTAGEDPKAVEEARKTLTYAIGGLVLVAAAYLVLVFVKQFTGVDVTQFKIYQAPGP